MVQQVTYAMQQQTKKYHIALHPGVFETRESFDLPFITSWFKKKGRSNLYTLEEIFEFCSHGRCIVPSHIEPNEDGTNYQFISSKLIFIDVDDDDKVTDPQAVLKRLFEVCAGLFYTSSHGIKGNRYRLVFVLDDYVRDEQEYKAIAKILSEQLQSIGIPADAQSNSPLQRMRTGMKGHIISNINAVYPIKQARDRIKQKQDDEMKKRAELFKEKLDKNYRVYSVEELKARAETIGYVENINDWFSLGHSIWSYVQEGFIDEIEGFEIFTILCGGNDESETWKSLSNPHNISIGTFIKYSNDKGFKDNYKYYHAAGNEQSNLKVRKVKFEKYIPTEYAKQLLGEEKNILVKSPTGSGKTSSFITASKEIAEELRQQDRTRFFIFAVPTIAICEQVAHSNNILAIKGNDPNAKKKTLPAFEFPFTFDFDEISLETPLYMKLYDYYEEGKRVIVCTYDMAETVYKMLEEIRPLSSYGLIVDEYHQFTSAYEYRHKAIERVYSLIDDMKSFIALSGTPEDILKDPFDYEVHVNTKYEKAPCQVWGAITYDRKCDEEPMLFELIKNKVKKGLKILVFIQSKEMIKRLKDLLNNAEINVAAVESEGKKDNPTYLTIVNESHFPLEVDVILTTSVLSDGININNESSNYECILVASQTSPLFDIAQVRQCANRFRNLYKSFIIYMMDARKRSKYFYNIESAYRYEKRLADNAIDILNTEFKGKNSYKLMRMGVLENRYGVDLDDAYKAYYNPLQLRYNVAEEKKRFYYLYRLDFIVAMTKLMGFNPAPIINISEALEAKEIDLSDIQEEILLLKAVAKKSNEEKRKQISLHFTQRIYDAFRVESDENTEILKEFKKAVTKEHFYCLKGIIGFTDYHTCLRVVRQVNRQADINKFRNHIKGFVNACHYKAIDRKQPTRTLYFALAEHLNELYMLKSDFNKMIKEVSRKTRVGKAVSAEKIAKEYFYIERMETGPSKGYYLRELTIEILAKIFELDYEQVVETVQNYAISEGGKTAEIVVGNIIKNT